jgi:hypothetical protein
MRINVSNLYSETSYPKHDTVVRYHFNSESRNPQRDTVELSKESRERYATIARALDERMQLRKLALEYEPMIRETLRAIPEPDESRILIRIAELKRTYEHLSESSLEEKIQKIADLIL